MTLPSGAPSSSGSPRVAVLGAGAWGATLADVLARRGCRVVAWEAVAEARAALQRDRAPRGVPELKLHDSVVVTSDLDEALDGAQWVVLVIPSQALAGLSATLAARPPAKLILASKGIDVASGRLLSEVVAQALPGWPLVVLSGPCIAREVAAGVPTTLVSASDDEAAATAVRDVVSGPTLRLYTQSDVRGVELGGALKNIIAIAAGMSDGLGFGANTKSALLTRGLAEMARLGEALGARPSTFYGLAGLGDLAVTCFSPHSRNRQFGERLAHGEGAAAARAAIGMTVEGEPTARAALAIAESRGVEMPITRLVVEVLDDRTSAADGVARLMGRELKAEG